MRRIPPAPHHSLGRSRPSLKKLAGSRNVTLPKSHPSLDLTEAHQLTIPRRVSLGIGDTCTPAVEESREVEVAEEVECDGSGEGQGGVGKLVYRSGSLHQAEDDVILVEVVDGSTEEEEETLTNEMVMEDPDKPESIQDIAEDTNVRNCTEQPIGPSDNDFQEPGKDNIMIKDEAEARGPNEQGNNNEDEGLAEVISKMITISVLDAVTEKFGSTVRDKEGAARMEHPQESSAEQLCSQAAKETYSSDEVSSNKETSEGIEDSTRDVGSDGQTQSFRSIGFTVKPVMAHKAMCTKELKTRSCKVNTIVIPLVSRSAGTGEDPRLEEAKEKLAVEVRSLECNWSLHADADRQNTTIL